MWLNFILSGEWVTLMNYTKKAMNSQGKPDDRRTRRNLLALGGILSTMLVASSFETSADGGRRGHDDPGRNHGGRDQGRNGGGCFLAGTRIRSGTGDVGIEELRAGDMVATASGELRVVKHIHAWEASRPAGRDWGRDVAPIKVARSALAPNLPERDLYLSPLHALYIHGLLIRVGALVNGVSIIRCSKHEGDTLRYFHIELEDHQAILAEGALVESKLAPHMVPFAPHGIGSGRRSEIASRLRSAMSPWIDKRQRFDQVRDEIEVRAELNFAA